MVHMVSPTKNINTNILIFPSFLLVKPWWNHVKPHFSSSLGPSVPNSSHVLVLLLSTVQPALQIFDLRFDHGFVQGFICLIHRNFLQLLLEIPGLPRSTRKILETTNIQKQGTNKRNSNVPREKNGNQLESEFNIISPAKKGIIMIYHSELSDETRFATCCLTLKPSASTDFPGHARRRQLCPWQHAVPQRVTTGHNTRRANANLWKKWGSERPIKNWVKCTVQPSWTGDHNPTTQGDECNFGEKKLNDQMLANQPQLKFCFKHRLVAVCYYYLFTRSYPGSNLTPPSCKKKSWDVLGVVLIRNIGPMIG